MNHCHGVEFLIKDSLQKYIKNIVAYSEEIIILHLAGTLIDMNLVQIYVPMRDKQNNNANFMSNCAMHYEQLRKIKLT